ncbi:hypothetical protein Ccrd_024477 [Cynara cardunculus var. scolymus]|uniref:Uncharacterized protein n=1 Tax=Cynara cardunculus var. scolymus TaxID=59895 RepID=A0A103XCD0_CYNCS|nr:hypothetical protein Ccrd_024477 [Cynara cardunculus var. scolymus]
MLMTMAEVKVVVAKILIPVRTTMIVGRFHGNNHLFQGSQPTRDVDDPLNPLSWFIVVLTR